MIDRKDYSNGACVALRPKLREYLTRMGIQINDKQFFSCIHPDHPDRHPSCSIGGQLDIPESVFHCFSCLPPHEKVRTTSGLKEIGTLKLGEIVYSQYGLAKVTDITKREASEHTIEIQLQNTRNNNIKFTGNHILKIVTDISKKVPYIKKRNDSINKLRMYGCLKRKRRSKKYRDSIVISDCAAYDVRANDYVVFPKSKKNISSILTGIDNIWISEYKSGPKNDRINTYPINRDTMWLLGLYCAEGSSYRGGITFTLHRNEKKYHKRIKRIIKRNFNLECSTYEYDCRKNTTNISCNSTDLQKFFDGFIGKGSSYKYMSDDIICGLSDELQRSWLTGLFDGDGTKKKPKRLTLVNENLISTAQQVMVNLEIPFSYTYKESYWGSDGIERKPTWSLCWLTKENVGCFYDTASDGFRYAFLRIERISVSKPLPEVFDITVDEEGTDSHTFMTKHYLVHNCGAAGDLFHAAHFLENKPLAGPGFYSDTMVHLCDMFDIPYEPMEIPEDVKRGYQQLRAYNDSMVVCHRMAFEKGELRQDHPAIKHLLDRGIIEKTIKKFKIGCVTDLSQYMSEMRAMGWENTDYLRDVGLTNPSLFNPNGIVIPIFDDRGRTVGYVTRRTDIAANDKGQEKYVNSVNSDIYHKGEILYNFNNYRREDGMLHIVEGYLDAVYMTQCGIKNVAAIGATVLTEDHVDMLDRHGVKRISLCLDADDGGEKGTVIAIKRISPYKKFNMTIVELPSGYDPDSYIREKGKGEFLKLAGSDIALSPFAWTLKSTSFEEDPLVTAERIIPTIAAEDKNIARLRMIKELARLTNINEIDIRKDVDSLVSKDSNIYLEELKDINQYTRVALNNKKLKDTKRILSDAVTKINNLEKRFKDTADSRQEFREKRDNLRTRIAGGEFTYGLRCSRFPMIERKFDGIPYTCCLTMVGGRPSAGKCLAPGTKIWMYDGSLKNVEDIVVGDLLMGDDSSPRQVLGTTSGYDNMWKIAQTNGIDYTVNSPHVLSLKRSRNTLTKKHGETIDIPLDQFLKKSSKFQNNFKGYKVPITAFKHEDTLLDPYFLGLWLGDGDKNSVRIYNTDKEIVNYLYSYAASLGLGVTENHNGTCPSYSITKGPDYDTRNFSLQKLLREEGLLGNKHIPRNYIVNTPDIRKAILAGILDSDGWYCASKGYYELTLKNENLIRQVKQVADTLGFRTNLSTKDTKCYEYCGMAHRLVISGDVWRIPVKVERKKASPRFKKDWRMSQITINSQGMGRYYGFELDGNGRFLLEDCTVTHNTTWITALGLDLVETNPDCAVFYMSIDDTTELMSLKMLAQMTGFTTSKIKNYVNLSAEDRRMIDEGWDWYDGISERFVLADATLGNTVDAMENHIEWFSNTYKDYKRVFLLDNFHKLRKGINYGSKKNEVVSEASEKIKELTQVYNLHLISTVELRKLERSKDIPRPEDMKDSVQMEYDTDIVIIVHNEKNVDQDTTIVWQGENEHQELIGMPYLELFTYKNKITGKTGSNAYQLNSQNLRVEEVDYMEVKVKRDEKKSHRIHGRGTRPF